MQEQPKRTFYIYCHTSPSGKRYIGQTRNDPTVRWGNGRGYDRCPYFNRAIKKYGWDNIEHSILMVCGTKQMADLLETRLIARFDTTNPAKGYNAALGGTGPVGVKWTDEHKKQHSERVTGRGNGMYGRHHTAETKALISKNRSGKPMSEEERARKTGYLLKSIEDRKVPVNQYDLDGNLIATFDSITDAAIAVGGGEPLINGCCSGKTNTAYGFKWARVGEELHARAKEVTQVNQHDGNHVIQFDMDGNEVARFKSLSEAERQTGIERDRIGDCCHGGLDSYGGFKWEFVGERKVDADKTGVVQFDLDGNELRAFDSLAEASVATGIPRYQIRNCCRGRQRTSNGFIWKFADEDHLAKTSKPKVRVEQLDLDGNVIARYESVTEAQRQTGHDRHRIVECCKGERDSYRGSKWRYDEAA